MTDEEKLELRFYRILACYQHEELDLKETVDALMLAVVEYGKIKLDHELSETSSTHCLATQT